MISVQVPEMPPFVKVSTFLNAHTKKKEGIVVLFATFWTSCGEKMHAIKENSSKTHHIPVLLQNLRKFGNNQPGEKQVTQGAHS